MKRKKQRICNSSDLELNSVVSITAANLCLIWSGIEPIKVALNPKQLNVFDSPSRLLEENRKWKKPLLK